MKKELLLLSFVFIFGCRSEPELSISYIGGEIANPTDEHIILFKDNKLVDSIPLDGQNMFSYTLNNAEQGLYTFKHPSESQTIYIEPGDSILFRLNTVAFDETLFYSGNAAEKNNFLMELFLLNEKNNDLIFSYYKIDPKDFAKITDSIKNSRTQKLKHLQQRKKFSPEFLSLAEKSIDYEYYDLRERYAFLINKYLSERSAELPQNFFDYRKKVDFNDESLQSHYVYQRFLDDYLKNRSIENCPPKNQDRECYNLNDFHNIRKRILLTDSIFTLEVLRKRFLQRFGRQQIIYSNTTGQIDSTLNLLSRLEYDPKKLEELKKLARVQSSYFIGNNVSNKKIIDTHRNKLVLGNVLNKPTIAFLWSVHSKNDYRKDHKMVQELRKKYPEINFMGINIDDAMPEIWIQTLKENAYDPNFEFQIYDSGEKKALYTNYLNKVLFINEKGEIIFGDIPFDHGAFEGYILEFLNQ